jgi:hypothetical protein
LGVQRSKTQYKIKQKLYLRPRRPQKSTDLLTSSPLSPPQCRPLCPQSPVPSPMCHVCDVIHGTGDVYVHVASGQSVAASSAQCPVPSTSTGHPGTRGTGSFKSSKSGVLHRLLASDSWHIAHVPVAGWRTHRGELKIFFESDVSK